MAWLALMTSIWGLAAPAAAADPPDLIRVVTDATIKQGFDKMFKVELMGYVEGGTFEVSGDGLALITPHGGIKPSSDPNQWRIKLAATTDATPGLRDLTYIGPDGQTDTLVNAIEVLLVEVIADTGISGHVFSDGDGNGLEDAGDTGLAGVAVEVVASDGEITTASTDAAGNYIVTGLAPGVTKVTYSTPLGATLTAGSELQTLTVVNEVLTSAATVGYSGPAGGGSVDILGLSSTTTDIAQGNRGFYIVNVTGADIGAAWSFSGTGLIVTKVVDGPDQVRLAVVAAPDADLGPHDLTVVNLDGATDTLLDALTVVP